MRTLIAFILVVFLASCVSKKPVVIGQESTVKDSVIVTRTFETVYDTITVPADSSQITKNISDITETPQEVVSANGRSRVSLMRKENQIIATSYCDELQQEVEIQKELIEVQRQRIEQLITTQQIEVEHIPWYYKALFWSLLVMNVLQFFKSKIPFL